MIKVEYSSNNSGGYWWLTDDDWKNLESAGWEVKWLSKRFLGALATEAYLECSSLQEAVDSFESITGQNIYAEGCPCCGKPHSFEKVD